MITAILSAVAVTTLACPARAAIRRKKAPSAVLVLPIVTAAIRSRAVTRIEKRRVRVLRTLPPEILFPGARVSQDVKCWTAGQRLVSVPHAATIRSAEKGLRPFICVRSTPPVSVTKAD